MTKSVWSAPVVAALAIAVGAPGAIASVTFPDSEFKVGYASSGLWGPADAKTGFEAINTTGTPHVRAGGFNMEAFDLNGASVGSFIAFCLDVTGRLTDHTPYEVTETPFAERDVSGRTGLIQSLFDSSYYDAADWTKQHWAGFQLAAWEIVEEMQFSEDDPTLDVTMGSFRLTSDNPNVETAANDFLKAASTYHGGQKYTLTYLQSLDGDDDGKRDSQSLVTMSPVPLPAAGLMLLGALGGGAMAYRKRRLA